MHELSSVWRLCIFSKFLRGVGGGGGRGANDVSYVAGEAVELTVQKKSVVVEEIKEVEIRSRPAQFIYDRIG